MAPTVEYATIIVLDIGKNVATLAEKNEPSFFDQAIKCAMRIIERNIIIQSKNLVGVILLGSNNSKNALAEQCKGAFKYIEMASVLQPPTWEMIRSLPKMNTNRVGDWFEALIVAAHHFKEDISGYRINSKKIVLISNFESPANIGKNFNDVVAGFQEDSFEVYVIGPELELLDSENIKPVKKLIHETNGETATFDEAMSGWLFHKKKGKKIIPQNFDLSFGSNVKIPVSLYIRVRDEPIVKNWQKAVKDPVTLTASATEGVKRERKIINTENQAVVEQADTIEGYSFGQQVIPFPDNYKSMLYQSGERSLSVYGFTSASSLSWQNLNGDGTYYMFGRKGDKKAHYAITCLVHCLHELKMVGVVRKVHSKNSEPKMFVIMPVIDTNNYVCLSLVGVAYKDQIKNMAFPPTELKKYSVSQNQVDAFKDLITAMDLTNAYDDSYSDTEAFPTGETVSPSVQYMLDCISYRAMNPGKPLSPPRDEIMTLFKVPPLLESRSKKPIEQLKKLFTLNKVERKKTSRKKEQPMVDDGQSYVELDKTEDDMPKVQLPNLNRLSEDIGNNSIVDPLNDYETLKSKGTSLDELSSKVTKVIIDLVKEYNRWNCTELVSIMKAFRADCVKSEPFYYNDCIQTVVKYLDSTDVHEVINENGLNVILQKENDKSTFTTDIMSPNECLTNEKLTINSEINNLFDEM